MSHGDPDNEDNVLSLFDHRLTPFTVRDGAVKEWICVDCEATRPEADDYSGFACNESSQAENDCR